MEAVASRARAGPGAAQLIGPPLPAYPSPRPRKTAKPEGPRGPGAPVDFPPFFKRMHYSPEMCLCVCRYSVVTIMPSVARPTFFLGGPPPYQNPGSPTDKILDPPRCFCFPPGPPRHPGPGALAPPAPPSHRMEGRQRVPFYNWFYLVILHDNSHEIDALKVQDG